MMFEFMTSAAGGGGGGQGLGSLLGIWQMERTLAEGRRDRDTATRMSYSDMLMQQFANDRNERLMREGWSRDDNAVQRRVADLRAAGLSPVLAAGSAAQSSGPIQVRAPEFGQGLNNRAQSVQMALQNASNVAQTLTGLMSAFHQMRLTSASATQQEAKASLSQAFAASELEELRQRTSSAKTRSWLDSLEGDFMSKHQRRMPAEGGISGEMMNLMRLLGGDAVDSAAEALHKRHKERFDKLRKEITPDIRRNVPQRGSGGNWQSTQGNEGGW